MGFYVRKTVKAGPLRFNVSRSGIGVSAGVPGFRVGSGTRGNYAQMGRHGVYYRTTHPRPHTTTSPPPAPLPQQQDQRRPSDDLVMQDTAGASALTLTPTGEGDIVEQLNAASKRHAWGWFTAIAALILGLVTMPIGLLIWLIGLPASWWMFQRDIRNRSVVLFYDVQDDAAAWFDTLVSNWGQLTSCATLWRTIQTAPTTTTHQRKIHAGAGHVVNRATVKATLVGPKNLKTNIAVPGLESGKAAIYFLPDRVLVREGKHYSDVSYNHLRVTGQQSQFIESPGARLPRDAQRVGETWQYVNVQGGPDRRYKQNPVRPIALYGHMYVTSPGGLDWRLQTSQPGPSTTVSNTLSRWPRPCSTSSQGDEGLSLAPPQIFAPPASPQLPQQIVAPSPAAAINLEPPVSPPRPKSVAEPRQPEGNPAQLTTAAVEPWAKPEWPAVDVAGASHNKENALRVLAVAGRGRLEGGSSELELSAELQLDSTNEYDANAVKVLMHGIHVGYLPRELAAAYAPALDDLLDEGKHLIVPGRLRVYQHEKWDEPGTIETYSYPSLRLPPVAGVQPFNAFPDEPYTVLPRGKTIQVTEEELHMDILGMYLGRGDRHVAVTLHTVERQKTPRSQMAELVEVRLRGEPIGVLTKAMSAQLLDLVRFVSSKNLLPVARARLAGSPLRVEATLDVAKSAEVTRDWMDSLSED